MKQRIKFFGAMQSIAIIALAMVIGFALVGCDDPVKDTHTHTAGAAATCTTPQICTNCGEVIQAALGHQGLTPAFAATCTEAGNSEAHGTCTRGGCGQVVTGTPISALGHLANSWNWTTYNSMNGKVNCTRTGCTGGFA